MCTPSLAIDCIIEVRPKSAGKDLSTSPPSGVVLVYRSQPPSEQYAIVGGFVNVGEAVEAAVLREVKEETNLDVSQLRLLGVYSDPKRDARRHTASVVYVGTVDSTSALRSGDDAKSAVMVPIDRLLSLRLAFDHRDILQDYLKLYKQK
jgi:8-oxo-dGTP diphosphatase